MEASFTMICVSFWTFLVLSWGRGILNFYMGWAGTDLGWGRAREEFGAGGGGQNDAA